MAHGGGGLRSFIAASSQPREYPVGVSMLAPIVPERKEGRHRYWNKPVFCTFAAMNVYTHSLAVDVAGLQIQGLVESEAAGINGCQIGLVLWR